MGGAGSPDFGAPCPRCQRPIGEHTLNEYAEELQATGFDYTTPFAEKPGGAVKFRAIEGQVAGAIEIGAAVLDSALGKLPALRFQFFGAGEGPMERVPFEPVTLIGDVRLLRDVAELVAASVDHAILACAEMR